jgi:hypothetical protein
MTHESIKCWGLHCPIKQTCLRYLADPAQSQDYYSRIPYAGGHCRYYQELIMKRVEIPAGKPEKAKPVRKRAASKSRVKNTRRG